jgi:hypothetical protein
VNCTRNLFDEAVVQFIVPIITELLLPEEVARRLDCVLGEFVNDVPVVHISGYKGNDTPSVYDIEISPDHLCELIKLQDHNIVPFIEGIASRFIESVFGIDGPENLRNNRNNLSSVGKDPVIPCLLNPIQIVLKPLLDQLSESFNHLFLDQIQPDFNVASCWDWFIIQDSLPLG